MPLKLALLFPPTRQTLLSRNRRAPKLSSFKSKSLDWHPESTVSTFTKSEFYCSFSPWAGKVFSILLLFLFWIYSNLISRWLQGGSHRRMYVSIRKLHQKLKRLQQIERKTRKYRANLINCYCVTQQEHRRSLQPRQIATWRSWSFRPTRRWSGKRCGRRQGCCVDILLWQCHHALRTSKHYWSSYRRACGWRRPRRNRSPGLA